ncbi:MAG: hypothetical protein HY721_11255 [Planctomycetes bacterium]|nr:hypothetical protein [Planctomycetota bacterium]
MNPCTALAAVLIAARASAPGEEAPGAKVPDAKVPNAEAAGAIAVSPDGLPPRSVPEAPRAPPVPDWVHERLRIGHLPGTGRMAAEHLKAGYEVVIVNALRKWDIVGPSASLYPKEEVEAAERYLRGHVEACRAAGAKAVFYIGPVQTFAFSSELVRAHPEWMRVRPDGTQDPKPNFANFRSGHAAWLLAQLEHLAREYRADGFWLDGYAPVHLHTYDEATRRLFREQAGGKELPPPPEGQADRFPVLDPVHDPLAREYLAWHEAHFVDLAARMRDAARRGNPECAIFANHSANRTWYHPDMYMGEYPLQYSRVIDVSSVELYWDVPGDPLYQQFVYAFLQGIAGGRGASVWIQPSAHGISGVSSPVEIQLRGLEGAPWGVAAELVESTGREEYLRLHVENVKAREEWWRRSEPVPYVGLVASEQTRRLYARGALPVYFSHALGAFRALLEKHLPVRVLTELDLEDVRLEGVRVLVLPNVACLSDRACEVVRRFVRAGGELVASFETSLVDAGFRRRADFALGDLFRARWAATHVVGQRSENLYLSLEAEHAAHPVVGDPAIRSKQSTAWLNPEGPPPERGDLALVASAAQVEALDGAKVLAVYRLNDPVKGRERHPAAIASEHGAGRVVYFPASVDKAMFFYPDAYQRALLANACRWAAREPPPLEVEGPLILTATFRRQPEKRRAVVHLLNQASSWGLHSIFQKIAPLPEDLRKEHAFPDQPELRGTWPVREEAIPIHGVRVICRLPGVTKAAQQPEGIALPLVATERGLEATVPKVDMHSMVVFE